MDEKWFAYLTLAPAIGSGAVVSGSHIQSDWVKLGNQASRSDAGCL